MARSKKASPKKKRSSAKRPARPSNRLVRFLRAFVVAGITGFSVGTYYLNPQWELPDPRQWVTQWQWPTEAKQLLSRLEWPSTPSRQQPDTPSTTAPAVALSGPAVQTQFSDCPQFFPAQRAPIVPAAQGLRELCFSGFAILHSGQTKTPVFVAQRLNRRLLTQAQGIKRTDRFYSEARLPKAERAELDDYRGSGYSRGHMAPAADMYNAETMAQSFSLANMVPQDQRHNAGPWSRIEQDTRKYVMRAPGDVYVFTGPVYSARPEAVGAGVAVPGHLYKLVYDATTGRSWAYWQANRADTRAGAPISYAELVKRTGIQFLSGVPLDATARLQSRAP